jgi:ATP-dependent RNA helicase DDX27
MEEDKDMGDGGALKAAIRSAKKSARPRKIGLPDRRTPAATKNKKGKKKEIARDREAPGMVLGQKPGHGEGVRAKKGDAISMKKLGRRK